MENPERPDPKTQRRCGAETRDGTPCEKYPAKGASRCRFHGGASTGPDDVATEHLDGNDHAVDNDGGAPELNTNAEIHGGFGDWRKAYRRFDESTRESVDEIADAVRATAAEYAPDVDVEERRELAREYATLSRMKRGAILDTCGDADGDGPGRGFLVEKELGSGDATVTVERPNPALRAQHTISNREWEIAETLRLWPGFRDDE